MLERHAGRVDPGPRAGEDDHIVYFDGVTWGEYERVLSMRGDRSAPRITYLDGVLEIMAPSKNHEDLKSRIGRLVEVFCLVRAIRFTALGSWTLKHKRVKRGAEPDECYQIGEGDPERRPDLAIEVEWTHGCIDKLDVYRKLGVREVWYWRDGTIVPYRLRGDRYRRAAASIVLRGIDLNQLVTFLGRGTTYDSIRAYRAALGDG